MGCVTEPRKGIFVSADTVSKVEGITEALNGLALSGSPGSESGARLQGLPGNPGDLVESCCSPGRGPGYQIQAFHRLCVHDVWSEEIAQQVPGGEQNKLRGMLFEKSELLVVLLKVGDAPKRIHWREGEVV